MIRAVFLTLACATALISASIISRATAPTSTDVTIKNAIRTNSAGKPVPVSAAPVRVVYAGYGMGSHTSSMTMHTEQLAPDKPVPVVIEAPLAIAVAASIEPAPTKSLTKTLVDLNTGSLEYLNASGGGMIGRAIVRGRPYQKLDDLLAKRVVSRATFQSIKTRVAVNY